jgi:hypothetical protein
MSKEEILAVISCKATKKSYRCPADVMYSDSPQYRHQIPFIQSYYSDYKIVSAKYGLLDRETEIDPYDITLTKSNHPKPDEVSIDRWALMVKKRIAELSFQYKRIDLHLSHDYVKHIKQVFEIPNVYLIKIPSMFEVKQNYDKAYELMEEKNDVNLEVISQYTKWKKMYRNEVLNKKIVLPWKL